MALQRMSDIFSEVFSMNTARTLGTVIANEANRRIPNLVGNYAQEQLDKVINKNKRGLQDILSLVGLDHGGTSDVYSKLVDRPDPLFDFEYQVIMPSISTPWASAKALSPLWIEDIELPMETFDVDTMKVNGHTVNILMHSSISEITVKIYNDYIQDGQAYINAWYASMRTDNGRYNLPYAPNNVGYKKMIQCILMKGNREVAVLSYSGCMPTGRSSLAYNSAGEVVGLNQNFSVDKLYMIRLEGEDPTKPNIKQTGESIGQAIGAELINGIGGAISKGIRGY